MRGGNMHVHGHVLLSIHYVQAKEYVARHEGALQERFAMSRSTKDLWARFKIMLAAVRTWHNHNSLQFDIMLFTFEITSAGNIVSGR